MTATISGHTLAARIRAQFPEAVIEQDDQAAVVAAENVLAVARFLRDDPELDCKYLNSLTAVDWIDYFEVVYDVSSLARNHSARLKARVSHERPVAPSLIGVWMGADLQEREAYDLMGITFEGHPRMRRMFLWEGFPGHPLRKDFLTMPGGFKPGLQRFPFEFPEGGREYPYLGRSAPEQLEDAGEAAAAIEAGDSDTESPAEQEEGPPA